MLFYCLCILFSLSSSADTVTLDDLHLVNKFGNIFKYDADKPLILTPFVESGQIEYGRNLSYVRPLFRNVHSYSGYFTVDKKYGSNMFFWYFPAEVNPESAPVILWLQGGPGASSMFGLFVEIGPYVITDKGSYVRRRDTYWSKSMHVIFIDNPVGAGFSFTNNREGYVKDEISVGNNLYLTLIQFFQLFPELSRNNFYAVGESYAGKYVPAICYTIHQNNPTAELKINLKGMAIGNGICDPINQLDYGQYLLEIGLIDEIQKVEFDKAESKIKSSIRQRNWIDAYDGIKNLLFGDPSDRKSTLLYRTTGFTNIYNYLEPARRQYSYLDDYLNQIKVKREIHVGTRSFAFDNTNNITGQALYSDFPQSIAPWFSVILDNYKVLMYNGQLDIIVANPLTANFLKTLRWCGSADFASADRKVWIVDGNLAGYIRTASPTRCNGSLSHALVRNASHTVPSDQPLWIYKLISEFTL